MISPFQGVFKGRAVFPGVFQAHTKHVNLDVLPYELRGQQLVLKVMVGPKVEVLQDELYWAGFAVRTGSLVRNCGSNNHY